MLFLMQWFVHLRWHEALHPSQIHTPTPLCCQIHTPTLLCCQIHTPTLLCCQIHTPTLLCCKIHTPTLLCCWGDLIALFKPDSVSTRFEWNHCYQGCVISGGRCTMPMEVKSSSKDGGLHWLPVSSWKNSYLLIMKRLLVFRTNLVWFKRSELLNAPNGSKCPARTRTETHSLLMETG